MNIIELTKKAVELASKDEKLKERTKDTVASIVMVLKNDEEHSFTLAVNKGKLEFWEEVIADPDFQFEMSEKDYFDLMTGKAYGMVLMATGNMKMTKGSWAQIGKIATPLGMIPKAGKEIAAKEESKAATPLAADKEKLNMKSPRSLSDKEPVGAGQFLWKTLRKLRFLWLAKVRRKLKRRVRERTADLEGANIYSQDFLDSIVDGLIVTDLEGNITAVNKAILRMNKRTEKEVTGKFAPEVFVKPQDIEKFMKYFPEAIEKGSAGPFEFIGVAKDGTEVPATTTLSLLKDAQGKPHGIFCIVRGKSELKRAEEKYAAVIDAMPDALIVLDTNGVILSVNPALTKMLGWKPEERVGKSFDEFGESIKAEDIERFMELLGKLIETGHVEPIETVLRAKDGREVPTSVTYSLIKDAEGNPQNIIASLRDISETKKLISELEESKNILDSIFNSTIDSIAIVNLDGVITEISQSSLERSGYSKEEITGRVATFLISEEDRAKFPNLIGEVMEEGFVKNVEITEITKDGRKIPVMFNAALMRDATKGEPIGIVAIARDITELKHAEEERRKAEAIRERAAIIDAMGDGLIVTDLEGNITLVNRAFLELYGYKEEELIGISAVNTPTIKPEHIEKVMGFMKEVIEKGSAGPIEMSGVTGDGKEIHTSFIASLLKDTQDNPTALFAVTRDITETKKLEQELLQSTKMVFLGIMAGGVAHEIRNPLAVINGAAQLLEKRCVSDKFVQKNIKVIRDAVSRASKVVSELLHFARSEPHTSFEPLSVNRIVEDSLSILENQLNIQQIKVKKDLADDLPLILGNANQLQQVIMNLMLNAQSAMPSGGDLTLETTHHNSQVVIKCSDKGEGISADDLGKIFDPFYTTKAPGQGTGLGLSISYQIVQQHGGIIEAYSTGKNCGSTFTIKLPQGELS